MEGDPDGGRADIARPEQEIVGSTSVAVDPRDPNVLYVTTTGGNDGRAPPRRRTGPARPPAAAP
jgi:hypothetical protein